MAGRQALFLPDRRFFFEEARFQRASLLCLTPRASAAALPCHQLR